MAGLRTVEAVESSDTDELLRIIDGHCQARSWDSLLELRQLLADAVARGKQLWGVDEHVRYRLVLEAPAPLAGPAVDEGPARFSLGPLTEVAASRHTFAELDPYVADVRNRAWIAHERVLRGEAIDASAIDPKVVELPLLLHDWEDSYPRATYHPDRVEWPSPPMPQMTQVSIADHAEAVDDPDSVNALAGLVDTWVNESNGRSSVVSAAGGLGAALRLLGVRHARAAPISLGHALGTMAWAAASGGAYGRRKGAAAGRLAAWWVANELAGVDWPPSPIESRHLEAGHLESSDLKRNASGLEWFAWTDLSSGSGWELRLAATSVEEDITWAIAASDAM